MTSSTSSTSSPHASQPRDIRFPPRSELPPGVTVHALPLLGTSWYERGFIYWSRRIGIGIIFLLLLFAYPAMIEGALQAISNPGTALYDGLAAGEVVFTIVTAVLLFRRMWRNSINGKGATRREAARGGRAGAGLGVAAFSMGGALAGLLVFASLITSGLVLASFAIWLVPVPPPEQYARRQLAERLRVQHKLDLLSPRSKHYGSKHHGKR